MRILIGATNSEDSAVLGHLISVERFDTLLVLLSREIERKESYLSLFVDEDESDIQAEREEVTYLKELEKFLKSFKKQ